MSKRDRSKEKEWYEGNQSDARSLRDRRIFNNGFIWGLKLAIMHRPGDPGIEQAIEITTQQRKEIKMMRDCLKSINMSSDIESAKMAARQFIYVGGDEDEKEHEKG